MSSTSPFCLVTLNMHTLGLLLVITILVTEVTWKWLPRFEKHTQYVWIMCGAAWGTLLAMREVMEPGFQWQEFAWPFFSVILFLTLHEVYRRVRRRS
jgi:hypothetical protein